MITVRQLKEHLKDLPDDLPVIVSEDAEGNGFSPLANVSYGTYLPESSWSGQAYPPRDELGDGDEWGVDPTDPDLIDAVFLDPVN